MNKIIVSISIVLFVFAVLTGCPSSDNPTYHVKTINQELIIPEGNQPNPVPEPATLILLGSGLVGLAGFGRRKRK